MNKYITVLLATVTLVLTSFLFKQSRVPVLHGFPVPEVREAPADSPYFYIYVFFSKKNCPPCLDIIPVLNALPAQFKVVGLIPKDELDDIAGVRETTQAAFPLFSREKYEKYATYYTPTLVGVSEKGSIYFVLPGVPGEHEYIAEFLNSFYQKNHLRLLQER
jgi:thiol-disulfide isomerase/thioredoxin